MKNVVLKCLMLLSFCYAVEGCKSQPNTTPVSSAVADQLLGDYGVQSSAGVETALRVSQGVGGYQFSTFEHGKWKLVPGVAHPIDSAYVQQTFGSNIPCAGLVTDAGVAVLKLPAGWHQNRFTTPTGYVLVLALGPMAAVKL